MIIKNALTYPDGKLMDINISNGMVSEYGDGEIIDAQKHLVIPSFSELHIHLDSAFISRSGIINKSGTLEEGIKLWDDYKLHKLNAEDVHSRVINAIRLLAKNGVTRIRTNVDVSDPELTALKEILKIKKEVNDVDIQVTAFPQHGIYTEKQNIELLEKSLEMGADNVGLAPHLENTYEDGIRSVKTAFDLAEKYQKNIDGHIDETDDPESRFIEYLCTEKIKRNFNGTVSAGHLTAMHSYNNQYANKIIKLISLAGVNVISNPLINMNLQGRYDSYPRIRGITRIRQMIENNVNVVIGQDCIEDPWYPLGTGDPLDALFMAVHAEPLMTPELLNYSLNMVTFNAARAFGIKNYGYSNGDQGDFIITESKNPVEFLQFRSPRIVIRKGKIIKGDRNE
ncbi:MULTISPECIES: amidohydrolase family protein [unclassified Acidiplasma]|uniref:amidohydrolase family protein n=1 Tax=unclassified Acidiplasma TaxID=2641301 RepID=UPI00064FEB92|nr:MULTISPECIES: amidohydrolase family protein [unclassified Acidiplasma]WMT54821.1 MAG: amidohydrolase family protein [Acidiplasma sp.]